MATPPGWPPHPAAHACARRRPAKPARATRQSRLPLRMKLHRPARAFQAVHRIGEYESRRPGSVAGAPGAVPGRLRRIPRRQARTSAWATPCPACGCSSSACPRPLFPEVCPVQRAAFRECLFPSLARRRRRRPGPRRSRGPWPGAPRRRGRRARRRRHPESASGARPRRGTSGSCPCTSAWAAAALPPSPP